MYTHNIICAVVKIYHNNFNDGNDNNNYFFIMWAKHGKTINHPPEKTPPL